VLNDWGSRFQFPSRAGNFSLHRVQNGSGAHPVSCPMGSGFSFPGVKRPEREADHSLSSAELKNARSYTSTPKYVLMAWCLVKHRDNSEREMFEN
jgi:hypothetical protein